MTSQKNVKPTRLRSITSRRHHEVDGPLQVAGRILVGGNLIVHGDLHCNGPLMCLGRLDVRGQLTCTDVLLVGGSITVAGDLRGRSLRIEGGFDSEDGMDDFADLILARLPRRFRGDPFEVSGPRMALTDEDVASELAVEQRFGLALNVGGDCVCSSVDAKGSIEVRGLFNPDDVDAFGCPVSAEWIVAEGDLSCGSLDATREVCVDGDLYAGDVDCMRLLVWGDATVERAIVVTAPDRAEDADVMGQGEALSGIYEVEAGHITLDALPMEEMRVSLRCGSLKAGSVNAGGSILVDNALDVRCHIRANRSITAGKSISCGKKHGVLAGLGLPRDQWFASGYICAPEKPQRILTGVYRELSRRRRGWALKPKR